MGIRMTPDSSVESFGSWVQRIRRSRGLSQRQVAGLAPGTLAAYESNRRRPRSIDQAARLARGLRVPLCSVYQRMNDGAPRSRLERLLIQERWQEAYLTVKQRQLFAHRRADTEDILASEALLGSLAQLMGRVTKPHGTKALITNPQEALDGAGWALRNSQIAGALMLLRPLEDSLPSSSPYYARFLNNMAYTHRALGDIETARLWVGHYIDWANDQSDLWQEVLAHAMWLEAGGLEPPHPDQAADHCEVLAAWRSVDTGAPDPGVAAWEWDARARTALVCGHMGQADRYVRQLRQLLDDHPLWYAEWVRLGELTAQLQAARGNLTEAVSTLRRVLTGPEAQALPRWQRLEATHTLVRLITQLDPDQGAEKWRQIIQIHRTLEAYPWIDRLYPEWAAVDSAASLDTAPLLI